jgi:hypothetical protein
MRKYILLAGGALMLFFQGMAQQKTESKRSTRKTERQERINNLIRQQEEGALVYNKQNIFGLRLNTDGWSAFYEKGIMKNFKLTNLYSLEFGEKKHPKEIKTTLSDGFFQIGNPFVYGKQNIFYQLKLGFGQQRHVGGKANKNGVAVQWVYAGGLSLGLERPYYVRVFDNNPNGYRDIKYTPQDSAAFLQPFNIIQGTGLRYGWRDMQYIPGIHAKTAFRFDYGRFNEVVSALEIGVNVEAYSRTVNIMLLNDNKQVFFNAYVALLFGKRK